MWHENKKENQKNVKKREEIQPDGGREREKGVHLLIIKNNNNMEKEREMMRGNES